MALKAEHCVDCGLAAPVLAKGKSLTITLSEEGWRIVRIPRPTGDDVFEWRCPTCWPKFMELHYAPPSGEPEDSDEEVSHHTCVGCGVRSPPAVSKYTLVSVRYGWRVVRRMDESGPVAEWRCPACWKDFKAAGGSMTPPSSRKLKGQ